MKLAALAIGLASLGFAALRHSDPAEKPWAVILGGDTDGYLSPCGCTEPMSGGVRRRATATRQLAFADRTVVLDNGFFATGTSRQDELKAETMAQVLRNMDATAINYGPADARLGPGMALSLQSLSGNRLTTASVGGSSLPLQVVKGPFLIGAASKDADTVALTLRGQPIALDQAVEGLLQAADGGDKTPILILQGDQNEARRLARKFPKLALIQYRSTSDAPDKMERIGTTVLATVGEHGKSIVRLTWSGRAFTGYTALRLTPAFPDDPTVSRVFDTYLQRVALEGLLDKLPRRDGPAYAGAASCVACHAQAGKVWKLSAHAHALSTLEKGRQSRDPDCVGCHVTGLSSLNGFRSRALNPQLAFVSCESCHGPAKAHARSPKFRLPKVTESTCVTCHTTLNSPTFNFAKYWAKIRH